MNFPEEKVGLNNKKNRLSSNFSRSLKTLNFAIKEPFLIVAIPLLFLFLLDLFTSILLTNFELKNLSAPLFNLLFAFLCGYLPLKFLLFIDHKYSFYFAAAGLLIFQILFTSFKIAFELLFNLDDFPIRDLVIVEFLRVFQFMMFGLFIWMILKIVKIGFEKVNIELEYKQLQINHYSLQLNPHFLFNTLLSLNHQIRKHSLDLHTQIVEFAHFLRYGFKNIEEENTLQEEVHALKSYIECQRLRFEEALALEFDVDLDNTLSSSLHFPKMILLTITENIFKHGDYKDQNNPVKIAGKLIENSGVITFHFSSQNNTKKRNFIEQNKTGLSTIEDILAYHFKDGYSLQYQKLNNQFHLNLQVNYDQRI